jgi:LmbE family N-acetylglucosaminyl deacetylase
MTTLVFFHAHPDDESIATAGTMARAAAAGHRVVLVLATKGEHGEVDDGFLESGETLTERRVRETHASAAILGVEVVEFLGYLDSGMMGTPENDLPGSFWQADLDEAAGRLAAILRREGADLLTIYDENGNYGHPDHIQVHRVGLRAAGLAGVDRVYEATVNRDELLRGMAELAAAGLLPDDAPKPDELDLGVAEHLLTTRVDVSAWLDVKRASMAAHASQIAEQSFFLAMAPEAFASAFGVEWYIRHGAPTPVDELESWLF